MQVISHYCTIFSSCFLQYGADLPKIKSAFTCEILDKTDVSPLIFTSKCHPINSTEACRSLQRHSNILISWAKIQGCWNHNPNIAILDKNLKRANVYNKNMSLFQQKCNTSTFFYQIEEEMLGGLGLLKVLTKASETQTSNQWVQRLWFVHRCALIFVMMGVYTETPL